MTIISNLRKDNTHKGLIIAVIFSSFAFLGYGLLMITKLHFGFNAPQLLSIYYLILAIGLIGCFIISSLICRKKIRTSSFIVALIILACTVNGLSSLSAQTFIVARFNFETFGMSNEEKIEYLYPDFIKFVNYCASQVPDDECIVVLNESYFSNYYLYPKKVYIYPSRSLEGLPKAWLQEKNIKWAIFYNSSKFKLEEARLVKLE